jgi:hypothetical protein
MNTASTAAIAKRWIHALAGAVAQGVIARSKIAPGGSAQANRSPMPSQSSTRQNASFQGPSTPAV